MPARASAYRIGHDVGRAYTSHAIALSFLFSLYVSFACQVDCSFTRTDHPAAADCLGALRSK